MLSPVLTIEGWKKMTAATTIIFIASEDGNCSSKMMGAVAISIVSAELGGGELLFKLKRGRGQH